MTLCLCDEIQTGISSQASLKAHLMQVLPLLPVLGEDSSPAGVGRAPGEVQPHQPQVLTALSLAVPLTLVPS